jgi:transposase
MEMSPRDNAEADASEPQPKRYQHIPLEVRSLVARFIVDHNHSAKEAASIYGINPSTATKIAARYRSQGTTEKLPRGGQQSQKLTDEMKNQIRYWIDENCTAPLLSIANRIQESFQVTVSRKTIERCLASFHYTLKATSLVPARRNDITTLQLRHDFVTELIGYDYRKVIFIDEVGFCYTMRLRRGRSARGQRANLQMPTIHSRNNSVAAAMSWNSLLYYRIQDRPYNTDHFGSFIGELCTIFDASSMNSMVLVMDNVAFHRSASIRAICEAYGHKLLFLPPYTPFLNPIENLFSKWKQLVKRGTPESPEMLLELIYSAASEITSDDCEGFYHHLRSYFQRCLRFDTIDN